MTSPLLKHSLSKSIKHVQTFYLIGDDSAQKQFFYRFLQIKVPSESQQIDIIIKQISQNQFIEVYDLPTDRMLRNSLQLYFNILPAPSLILYFLKIDSTPKEIRQWIKILKPIHLRQRIMFISDASTYLEREKIILRIEKEFDSVILENICFGVLEPSSLSKLTVNTQSIGIEISRALCLKPTLREQLNETWSSFVCRVRSILGSWRKKDDQKSVV